MGYRVKGWDRFQHFKDRKPIWIKLYRDILDDLDWHELDGDAAKALVMLWLIASEDEGALPDIKKIAFRLRVTEQKAKSLMDKLSHWLEQDDIKPISDVHQVDDLEKRREETEKEKKQLASSDESLSADVVRKGALNGEAVEVIPLIGGKEWGVSKAFLAELERAYPIVDGPATLKEIRAWCVANPSRCKTEKGVARFINSWFGRIQDRG